MFSARIFIAALGALALVIAAPADADSVTFTDSFEFDLGEGQQDDFGYITFEGSTQVLLPQFSGDGLQKVTLTLDGIQIFGYVERFDDVGGQELQPPPTDGGDGGVHGMFAGRAESPGLLAEAAFAPYVGVVFDLDIIAINVTNLLLPHAMDMTDSLLGPYQGNGDVPVDVFAMANIGYEGIDTDGLGSFQARGEVSLTYQFEGDEVIVPTPSAAAAGLTGLFGLGLARRRRRA